MGEKYKSRSYEYSIGDTFQTRHGIMTIVDAAEIQWKDKRYRRLYTLRCERGHQYDIDESYLKAGRLRTCKKCNHPTIMETDPEFGGWFVDSAIPYQKSRYSHSKADFYCQKCGKIAEEKNINTIYQRGYVPCPYCSSGISYPERYIYALLLQMNISFVREYADYFHEEGRKRHYKYDFYDRDRNLVIEVHGEQHFLPGSFEKMGGYSLKQIEELDLKKKRYATEVLGMDYVYLDCRKSDPNWIRNQVTKKLSFYPLEAVDWKAVRSEANASVTVKLIELCRQGYTQKKIAEMVHLHPATVSIKLRKAVEDGLFDGITPRILRAEENKKTKEENRKKYLEKKRECEKRKKIVEKCRARENTGEKELPNRAWNMEKRVTVLDEYVNGRIALRFICKECHQSFRRAPDFIKMDHPCPYCKRLAEIRQRSREKYGYDYEIMGVYTDGRTPLQIRHNVCGRTFYKTPQAFFRYGCPECGRRQRIEKSGQARKQRGDERFYQALPEIKKRGYTFVGEECKGWGKKNAFRCSYCGEIWLATAGSILNGRDHICISPCKKKTHSEFVEQVQELTGNEYSVLTKYQDAFTKIKMRHNLCGLEYPVAPVHFTSKGGRCPVCTNQGCLKAMDPEQKEAYVQYMQKLYTEWEQHCQLSGGHSMNYLNYLWNRKLEDVKEFYEVHGHIDIPYGYMVNGYNLGSWIAEQRKSYGLGRLSAEKTEALEALGIKWHYREKSWNQNYEQVKKYLEQHGKISLSCAEGEKEKGYYYWINDQIKLYRKGRLDSEKIVLLKNIGIQLEYVSDLHFDIMVEKLRDFVELHGHCIVPLDEGAGEEMPLGLWAQRMRLQILSGQMADDRVRRLQDLGLPVNNKEAKFQQKFQLLKAYREKNGHLKIPQSYQENGQRLGKWINSLRVCYAKGRLSEDRIRALESIDMVW